jgi:signal transduction histidine kinase
MLEASPGCAWALRRDLAFERVFGDPRPLFGAPSADLAGRGLPEVLPPGTLALWRERVARVFAGESLRVRERAAAGLFSVSWYPVRDGGRIAFAAAAAHDLGPWIAAERALRGSALKVLQDQESERARLARFLHDEVGQCLSAAGLQLDLLRMDLEPVLPGAPARAAEVQRVLERVMERVREIARELKPEPVDGAGLYPALDRLVGRLRREFHGTLRLTAGASPRIAPAPAHALYRIAGQALDNAIRHSGCSAIQVRLQSTRAGTAVEVRDNGAGFDPAGDPGSRGFGLLAMEACAAEAGIELTLSSRSGRGAVVRAVARAATAAAND